MTRPSTVDSVSGLRPLSPFSPSGFSLDERFVSGHQPRSKLQISASNLQAGAAVMICAWMELHPHTPFADRMIVCTWRTRERFTAQLRYWIGNRLVQRCLSRICSMDWASTNVCNTSKPPADCSSCTDMYRPRRVNQPWMGLVRRKRTKGCLNDEKRLLVVRTSHLQPLHHISACSGPWRWTKQCCSSGSIQSGRGSSGFCCAISLGPLIHRLLPASPEYLLT